MPEQAPTNSFEQSDKVARAPLDIEGSLPALNDHTISAGTASGKQAESLSTGLVLFSQHVCNNGQAVLSPAYIQRVKERVFQNLRQFLLAGLDEAPARGGLVPELRYRVEVLAGSRHSSGDRLDLLVTVRNSEGQFMLPPLGRRQPPLLSPTSSFCGHIISIDDPIRLNSRKGRHWVSFEFEPLLDEQLKKAELLRLANDDWSGVYGDMLKRCLSVEFDNLSWRSRSPICASAISPEVDNVAFLVALDHAGEIFCLIRPSSAPGQGALKFEVIVLERNVAFLRSISERTFEIAHEDVKDNYLQEAKNSQARVFHPGGEEMNAWASNVTPIITTILRDWLKQSWNEALCVTIEAGLLHPDEETVELLVSLKDPLGLYVLPMADGQSLVGSKDFAGLVLEAQPPVPIRQLSNSKEPMLPLPTSMDLEPFYKLTHLAAITTSLPTLASELLNLWEHPGDSIFSTAIREVAAHDLRQRGLQAEIGAIKELRIEPVVDDDAGYPSDFVIWVEHDAGAHVLRLSRSQAGRVDTTSPLPDSRGSGLHAAYFFTPQALKPIREWCKVIKLRGHEQDKTD